LTDRFSLGFYSGVIAGLLLNALNLVSYYFLNIATLRYLDFMAIIIYGNKPMNAFDTILALIIHLGFTGMCGVFYFYTVPLINTQNHMFKGILFGLTIFMVTYSITFLLKVNELMVVPPYTVASNVVTSSIYGLSLAKIYKDNIEIDLK
jgi:hypothetical protein